MLLAYLNPQTALPTQTDLAKEFDPVNPSRGDTTPTALVGDFQSRGYTQVNFQLNLSIDSLKQLISFDIPIICRGGFDNFPNHYIVVRGYDDNRQQFIVNDPTSVRNGGMIGPVYYSEFDQSWTSGVNGIGQRNGLVVPYKGLTYIPPPS